MPFFSILGGLQIASTEYQSQGRRFSNYGAFAIKTSELGVKEIYVDVAFAVLNVTPRPIDGLISSEMTLGVFTALSRHQQPNFTDK